MGKAVDRGVLVGVGLVLAALVLNAGLAFRNTRQLDEDAAWVGHTHLVLDLISEVELALVDAETGERGYLLTDKKEFLEPYLNARARLDGLIAQLKHETLDNDPQQGRIDRLEAMIRARLARLKQGVELKPENVELAREFVAGGQGKQQMDLIRRLTAEMKRDEVQLLQERDARSKNSYYFAIFSGLATALAGLASIGAFVWLLGRSLAARRQAAATVEEQREWLRVTLASVGDAVIATNTQGRVVLLNPVAERLTGWEQLDARNHPIEDVFRVVNEQTRKLVESPILRALREGKSLGMANHTVLIGRDGEERPIEDSAAPIRDKDGQVVGVVLIFRDASERRRAERERQQLLQQERAARALAESGEDRLAFLAEASLVLSSTLDYGQTLESVARLAISRLADWCSVDVLVGESSTLERVAAVHKDPAKIELVNELRRRYPPDPAADRGLFNVLRTGQPELVPEVSDALLQAGARDPEHLEILRGLGLKSVIIVPMVARGVALGALVLASEQAGRRFGTSDLALSEDLARRCASAIDNSRLYQQAQEKIVQYRQAQEQLSFLVEASAALTNKLEPSAVLASILRLSQRVLPGDAHGVWRCEIPTGRWAMVTGAGLSESYRQSTIEQLEKTPRMPDTPVVADDVLQLPMLSERREQYRAEGIRSLLAAPLRIHGQVSGTLVVYHRQPHHYSDAEVRLATALGDLSAAAITSADLYEEQATLRITAQEQGEALRHSEEQLREVDRRKDEFLALLGHELRNPLAPIANGLQLLKLPGADATIARRAREMMDRQVEHMVRLVDDLLDVSRIMRGKVELRREPVELATVIARAVETSQPAIDAEGHRLALEVPSEPIWVDGDLVRLAQVVSNLLNNAAKYTGRGGQIQLTAAADGDQAVLRVRDSGIGIAPEVLPRLFDMFFQAERRTKNSQGGLGIGLSLVRGLVELHGGTVEAHSAGPGTGSEFVVRLPLLAKKDAHEEQSPADQPSLLNLAPRRVLVVDDNVDAADSLAMLLRLEGQEVEVAYDGSSALALAENAPPTIAFLDLGMPKMDGYELAREFRARSSLKNVELVALTGWGQPEHRQRTREAGFDHHLVKPVDAAALHGLFVEDVQQK